MRTINYFLSVLVCFVTFGCVSKSTRVKPENHLSYTISPGKSGKSLNVLFEMNGSPTGETLIKRSRTWAGNNFTEDISEIKVLNKGASLEATAKGDKNHITKIVKHKPNEKLKISYRITQNVPTPDKTYRAIIKEHYFHIIGQAALVTPDVKDGKEPYQITMEFSKFPSDFKYANSFFTQKKRATFVASINEFLYGVYVGGDFRVKKIMIKDKPLYVSIRGKWKFKDEELFNLAKNIVSYQRNFFNDHQFEQFLINVLPNERTCCSSGGTGLTNSFATFLPNDATFESHLKFLLSHELFHTWNGRRIRRVEPEQLVYWFSEGFADYYSRLLLLRSGDITLKEFVDDYNEVLYEYYTSNAINYPNKRILEDFWNDYQVEKLPYQRGNILARKWNAKIKTNSNGRHSLDDIFIDFFKESQSVGTKVSADNFTRISGNYYPGGFKDDVEKCIDNGATLIPGENDMGPCVKRSQMVIGKFEHGYSSEKSYKSKIITGLKKSSNAYKAGLRNGDKLLGRKIIFPPMSPSWIRVKDNKGRDKKIIFWPIKEKKLKAYFFKLDDNAFNKNSKECLAWFQK